MAKASDIQKGLVILFKNEPHLVTDFQHVNPGKGGAFIRTKLKSLKTGKVLENTFKVEENIDFVDLERKKVQFLYQTDREYTFMDMNTFEQFTISEEILGQYAPYLKEGLEVNLLVSEGTPITVDFPKKVVYKVIEAPPAVKGDTATNVTKEITLENGLKIKAPLFIKENDLVIVNTETGEYVERASGE